MKMVNLSNKYIKVLVKVKNCSLSRTSSRKFKTLLITRGISPFSPIWHQLLLKKASLNAIKEKRHPASCRMSLKLMINHG